MYDAEHPPPKAQPAVPPLNLREWLEGFGIVLAWKAHCINGGESTIEYVEVPAAQADTLHARFENAQLERAREITQEKLTAEWNRVYREIPRRENEADQLPEYWCDPGIIPDCPGHEYVGDYCPGYREGST